MNRFTIATFGVLQTLALTILPMAPATATSLERTLTIKSADGLPVVDAQIAVDAPTANLILKTDAQGQVKFNSQNGIARVNIGGCSQKNSFGASLEMKISDGVADYSFTTPTAVATYRVKVRDETGFEYSRNSQTTASGTSSFNPVFLANQEIHRVKDSVWTGDYSACSPAWVDENTLQFQSFGGNPGVLRQLVQVTGGTEYFEIPVPQASGVKELVITIKPVVRLKPLSPEYIMYTNQAVEVGFRATSPTPDFTNSFLTCSSSGANIRGFLRSNGSDTISGPVTASSAGSGVQVCPIQGGGGKFYYQEPLKFKIIDSRPLIKLSLKVYKTCKALNAVYPGGIKKSLATSLDPEGVTKTAFYSPLAYKTNSKLDRAKSGVVCPTKY